MAISDRTLSLVRQARSDRVLLIYLAIVAVLHIPFLLPTLTEDQLYNYSWAFSCLFLLPSLSFLLWPYSKAEMSAKEVAFWKILSVAFLFWWAGGLLNWLMPRDAWTVSVGILGDSIYLGYYVCWMGALNLVMRQEQDPSLMESGNWLHASALIVLAFWLFAYFVLIPSQLVQDTYATWVPSLLFYSALDLALAILFCRLAYISHSPRWSVLFGLMAIASFIYCILDALESLDFMYEFAWIQNTGSTMLWSLPFPLVALFARARHYSFPQAKKPSTDPGFFSTNGSEYSSAIILMAFLPPVIHLTLGQLHLLSEESRLVQEASVLISLVVFLVLVILENRHIRTVTRTALEQEKELVRLRLDQEVAEQVQKAKGRFLANISHEIRTPLSGILGMVELQLLDEPDPGKRRRAKLVKDSARNLTRIIDDILDYSNIESGNLLVKHEPFQLDDVASQVCEQLKPGAREKGVTLTLEFQPETPTRLEGDESRFRQVLTALAANGIKFTERGHVQIHISSVPVDDATANIVCRVTDSGIGIDEAQLKTLFMPFSKGDDSRSQRYGGSGLGLAIARQVVEALCGRIGAHNNPGGGSTFWFEIPFSVVESPSTAPAEPSPEEASPSCRILLAEDELTCQLVTAKQLECLGYEVDIAKNGREAVQAARHNNYDLVLMDCRMPVLDGLEATRQIRALDSPNREVPIVALTAHAKEQDELMCVEAGMNDFIVKPAMLDDFKLVLARWLKLPDAVGANASK